MKASFAHPLLFLAILGCAGNSSPEVGPIEENAKPVVEDKNRPLLAIWRKHDGFRKESEAPYLRIAIWNDGRLLFARDAEKWSHDLRQGRISAARVAELKKAIVKTQVFDLKGYCYLVPSGPCDCLMLDLGDQWQMLYWDERETPGYGINIDPKPHHLKFKERWKAVNKLALEARPEKSEAVIEPFQPPPDSWYLKKAIASE